MSRAGGAPIDAQVKIFTALISLATGVLFGLAPMFQLQRVNAKESLQQGTRIAGGLQARLRSGLVIGQVAVTLVLLIGAGLMTRSILRRDELRCERTRE